MKKYLAHLLLAIGLVFVSCGGDDITPSGQTDFNILQITGKKEGIVKINLLPGTNQTETELAEVIAFQLEGIKNSLQFSYSKPEIIVGGASAINFKLTDTDKECLFSLGKYIPNNTIIEGDKIPAYIREWFPKNNIAKIEIGEVLCEKGATYNITSATTTMIYNANISIYDAQSNDPITGYSLEFEYIGLKNK